MSVIILLAFMYVGNSGAYAAHPYFFKTIDKEFDDIAGQLNQKDYDNERQTIDAAMLDKLEAIAERSGSNQLRARALYWRVRSNQMSAQPSLCIEMLEKAKRLSSGEYDYDNACIDYQLAGNYERIGSYIKTYKLLGGAIETFSKYDDNFFLGNAYLLMAQMFIDIDDYDSAAEQLTLSKESYSKAGYPLNRIYFFEALLDEDNSIALYKKSISTGEKDWGMTLQAITNLSSRFLRLSMPDSAEFYCDKGFEILKEKAPGNTLFHTLIAINRVQVFFQQEKYDIALRELKRLEARSDQLKGERFLLDIYKYLWLTNDRLRNREVAYEYLKLYQNEYERLEGEIKKRDVPKAQAREEIIRQNDKIRLLKKDAELNRNYFYVALLICLVIVLVAVAVTVFLYQRYRIRKIENRELRNSLQQEALIYSVNRKNFENDIKQKDCEISSSTLLLANKNEVLQQIHDITKTYSDEGKIPREYVKQINDVIGDSLKNDDEWSRFKLHFDSVHPDFFVKLKEASSELTENDLRLCAYVRIGMRAKQIAEMLSVSPDSVNSNRYRLRKKFGLERGQKLDDYIRQV